METTASPKLYNYDRYVISTALHVPKGTGPFPAVVLIPDLMGQKEQEPLSSLALHLAEKGIIALSFDPTGSGESEGTIAEDYYLSNIMNDIDVMVGYLGHQSFVKKSAIGLYGVGMGALLAISFANDYPEEISAIAISALPATLEEFLETQAKPEKSLPESFFKDARRMSASFDITSVKSQILAIGKNLVEGMNENQSDSPEVVSTYFKTKLI